MKRLSGIISLHLILICSSIALAQENRSAIAREYFTEYGVLTFTVKGSKVTGKYAHESGKIEGELKADELKGTWQQSDGGGTIEITFSSDFNTFKARYNHTQTPDKWKTDWSGMRKPALLVREYKTTWGALVCNFEGSQVSCSYPWYNGKLLGELKGTSFTGLWLQSNGGVGTLRISFADDFSSFKGTYNDFNFHPDKWYEWTGILKK